jgi:hypothetical protein
MKGIWKPVFCAFVVFLLPTCIIFGRGGHPDYFDKTDVIEITGAFDNTPLISPHLECPIKKGENLIWCGTFQIAWNELSDFIGGDVHFDCEDAAVAVLNKKTFNKSYLEENSYVAAAGNLASGIIARIKKELQYKFKGAAKPRLLDEIGNAVGRPQDIIFYSYLFKQLEFNDPFEIITEPIDFDGDKVICFGQDEKHALKTAGAYMQVLIHNYDSPDNFVIELVSKSAEDQIILAKINPGETLIGTINSVLERMDNSIYDYKLDSNNPSKWPFLYPYDILKIPKINIDVTRHFEGLMGGNLISSNPKIAKDLQMLIAEQYIRFQMDEKGVTLLSESGGGLGCASSPDMRPKRIMIFDKPYLIMLKQKNAPMPYFAFWVGNPDLLAKPK